MSLPAWVPETETKPAPMPLLIVQSFVNTWEGDSGSDLLGDPSRTRRWLQEAGLLEGAGADDSDLTWVREFREGIRSLLVHNGGGPAPDFAQLTTLRAVAHRCRLQLSVLSAGNVELQPAAGAGLPALGQLLLIVRDAQRDGTWERLKACRNPDCRWAFYDRSHAGRGAWCDMAVCGNRIKNRNLRSRRAGAARRPALGAHEST
jgi:predicted RNA-binding Zn ribbon-like protein